MSLLFVDIEEVYRIHLSLISRAKTKAGVRDFALLHSSIERPKATFNGHSLYPTLFAKAAALLHSLCLSHPFTDGNKRTAYSSTHLFLWKNGYNLVSEKKEAIQFMLLIDNEEPSVAKITTWLKKHSVKIS